MKAKYTCPGCGLGQQQVVDLESWDLGVVSVECDDCGVETHQVSGLLKGVKTPIDPVASDILRGVQHLCPTGDTVRVSSGVLLNFIKDKMAARDSEIQRLRSQLEAM
jgi:hypothetical protein